LRSTFYVLRITFYNMQHMRSPFLIALLHPLNILMLALSVAAGLIAAWWLFPLGLLFWLVMVIAVARDPSLRISHQLQQREPLAQRFQRYFDRIERSQVGVFNSLASAPARTRRALQPVQAEVNMLVDRAYALCKRMTGLENYRVVSQSRADMQLDLQQIEAKIQQADDALVKREYEESRQALQERLAKLDAVSKQLERVEAQLMSLTNEMDAIVTEVIRLQAVGPEDATRSVPALVKKIREEAEQLRQFEKEAMRV
jgi:chromosome segregation ATPase